MQHGTGPALCDCSLPVVTAGDYAMHQIVDNRAVLLNNVWSSAGFIGMHVMQIRINTKVCLRIIESDHRMCFIKLLLRFQGKLQH